jgi:hypothetical protein
MREYLGPNSGGTGELFTVALQYDLSLGYLLRYPFAFRGDGPDVVVSLFGIETHVSSKEALFDNVTKRKAGVEASYAMLPWLASSIRVDRVVPNANDGDQSFSIVSPRLIFRTGWQAHDQVVLQYSHWFYGGQDGKGDVRSGYPAVNDATIFPDGDVVSLSASMWW